jgi:hypothetical protein
MSSTISGYESQREYFRGVRTETLQRWLDTHMYRPGSPLWQAAKDVIAERARGPWS